MPGHPGKNCEKKTPAPFFALQCLTHTHQLGIDMQLFAVAPLLVYPLWRWPRLGAALLAALAAWSTALRHRVVLAERLSTVVYFGVPVADMFRTANLSYILPTHRLTVYAMGVALGYALHRVPESFRFPTVSLRGLRARPAPRTMSAPPTGRHRDAFLRWLTLALGHTLSPSL